MNFDEYSRLDATALAGLVRKKEVSAKELRECAISAVGKVNGDLNAVIETYPERVNEPEITPSPNATFPGLPIFYKDLGTAEGGKLLEMGSRLTKGYRADADCFMVTKFKEAGFVNLGRTTTPEMGASFTAESTLTGATRNPYNTERIAGGSSGGSAAIVAAGVVPVAQSGDGGGSTRVPAAICGLVGLKCSRGRVSIAPKSSDLSSSFLSKFVVSRSVRDTAAMLDALSGPAPGESIPFAKPDRPFVEEIAGPNGKLKIAVSIDGWSEVPVDPEVAASIRKIGKICEDLGHHVEEVTPEVDFERYLEIYQRAFTIGISAAVHGSAPLMGREVGPDTVEPVVLGMYEEFKKATLLDYLAIPATQNVISRQLGDFFTGFDLLLTPTMSIRTPKVGEFPLTRSDISAPEMMRWMLTNIPFTPLSNFTGTPAIAVPASTDSDGMPLGAHFIGPMGGEPTLIQIAAQLEEANPWADRRPGIHVTNE